MNTDSRKKIEHLEEMYKRGEMDLKTLLSDIYSEGYNDGKVNISLLPDEMEICRHFSVPKDYVSDGSPYEPETSVKNKYRREGAMWYNNLIRGRGKK